MKLKRKLSLALSLLMLLTSFASCASGNSDKETKNEPPSRETGSDSSDGADSSDSASQSASETEETIDDGLEDVDFGGYDFRILSVYWNTDEGAHYMIYEDVTGNPVNDELNKAKNYVENRFKVKLSIVSGGDPGQTKDAASKAIKSGENSFDITMGHDHSTFELALNGLFIDMKTVEQFDFSKPWWPDGTVENLSIANRLYCASNYISYTGLHWTRAVMINKDLAADLNKEVPYDMVREGKWTLDEMILMVGGVSEDLDGNGKIDQNDRVGFTTGTQTSYCLQESMGINPYPKDENGMSYLNLDVDRIDTFISKWRELARSRDYYYSTGAGFGEDVFNNANTLLVFGQIGDAYDIYRNVDMRYGFLPSPKFDELQENYINCCTDLPWAIPKTARGEQLTVIGTVCEALSAYNYKNVLPVYFDVAMKSRTADSPDDAEMLQLIADTRTISFAHAYSLKFSGILNDVGTGSQEVASYIKSNEKMAQKTLDKLISKVEKFGE